MLIWSELDEIVKHKRRYSKAELIGKLVNNCFTVSRCTSFMYKLFPLMLLKRLFNKKRVKLNPDEVKLDIRVKFLRILN